jgi:ABC-2 type transport system permease protein
MSASTQTWDLIRREIVQRAKSRTFQIMMLVTVSLILGFVPLLATTLNDPDPTVVGLVGEAEELRPAVEQRAAELDTDVVIRTYATIASAEAALRAGEADVAVAGDQIIWLEEASTQTKALVLGAQTTTAFRAAAAELGMSAQELAARLAPEAADDRLLVPPDPDEEPRRIGAFIGLLLLYMSILIFGQFVAMGVIEEKQNRVVEVVLSRVTSTQVLVGKVVGIGLLGLFQLVVIGGSVWLAASLVDLADVSVSDLGMRILAGIVFWFVLGYGLYAVIYAAVGSTVSRQEDMQGALMVPALLVVPGILLGQVAVAEPDSTVAVVASLVPLWSPMVMPMRSAVSDVPWWELGLAIALVLVTGWGLIRLGARVYDGAILRLGAKVRLRDAWRSAPQG